MPTYNGILYQTVSGAVKSIDMPSTSVDDLSKYQWLGVERKPAVIATETKGGVKAGQVVTGASATNKGVFYANNGIVALPEGTLTISSQQSAARSAGIPTAETYNVHKSLTRRITNVDGSTEDIAGACTIMLSVGHLTRAKYSAVELLSEVAAVIIPLLTPAEADNFIAHCMNLNPGI